MVSTLNVTMRRLSAMVVAHDGYVLAPLRRQYRALCRQAVEAVGVTSNGELVDLRETSLSRVAAKGRATHDGPRLSGRLLDHSDWQTVQHAEGVIEAFDI